MISKSFGKDEGFTAGLLFLGFIFWPILAFGSAKYLGPYGDPAALPHTRTNTNLILNSHSNKKVIYLIIKIGFFPVFYARCNGATIKLSMCLAVKEFEKIPACLCFQLKKCNFAGWTNRMMMKYKLPYFFRSPLLHAFSTASCIKFRYCSDNKKERLPLASVEIKKNRRKELSAKMMAPMNFTWKGQVRPGNKHDWL